jgi:hypothetical protein
MYSWEIIPHFDQGEASMLKRSVLAAAVAAIFGLAGTTVLFANDLTPVEEEGSHGDQGQIGEFDEVHNDQVGHFEQLDQPEHIDRPEHVNRPEHIDRPEHLDQPDRNN